MFQRFIWPVIYFPSEKKEQDSSSQTGAIKGRQEVLCVYVIPSGSFLVVDLGSQWAYEASSGQIELADVWRRAEQLTLRASAAPQQHQAGADLDRWPGVCGGSKWRFSTVQKS